MHITIRRTVFAGAATVLAALAISGSASAAGTTGAETAGSWSAGDTALNFTHSAVQQDIHFVVPGA